MDKPLLAQLRPRIALLGGEPGRASLQILLVPFLRDAKLVDTSIHLDTIRIPTTALAELVGKTFKFPVNPDDGYIDGSIYLDSMHQPVDVTTMAFHLGRNRNVSVVLKGVYNFYLGECGEVEKVPFAFGVEVATCGV